MNPFNFAGPSLPLSPIPSSTRRTLSSMYPHPGWLRERGSYLSVPDETSMYSNLRAVSHMQFLPENPRNYLSMPSGLYVNIGSLSLPTGSKSGAALFLCFNLNTRKIFVISERQFYSIDGGVFGLDQPPDDAPAPLRSWLWAGMHYYRSVFFVYQESEQRLNKHLPNIRRAFPKPPRPVLNAYKWGDFDAAMTTVYDWLHLDRIRMPDRQTWYELQQYESDPSIVPGPFVHALCYGIGALDKLINHEYNITRILNEVQQWNYQ